MKKWEAVLTGALSVGVLDTAYLTWRFVALQAGWVEPGTGLCSWTPGIDCDVVLSTPEARSFYVPNAVLGWGFFSGALLWWVGARRVLPEALSPWALRLLTVWLGIATLLTFWFFALLLDLPALCPFCPWNHVWTWAAFGAGVVGWRSDPNPTPLAAEHRKGFALWAIVCSAWCLGWQFAWITVTQAGWLGDGGPPPLF